MNKHVIAITYAPKIAAVKNGTCRQTIRAGRRFAVGDEILLHTWAGKPYRSKWDWRKRETIKECLNIVLTDGGMIIERALGDDELVWWDSVYMDRLAKGDGIQPPTGYALRDALRGLNNGDIYLKAAQIIRW